MFGIGIEKLLVIAFIAMIVVGPQKLPEMARAIGKAVGEFKAQTDALRSVMSLDVPASPSVPQFSKGATTYGEAAEHIARLQQTSIATTDTADIETTKTTEANVKEKVNV